MLEQYFEIYHDRFLNIHSTSSFTTILTFDFTYSVHLEIRRLLN